MKGFTMRKVAFLLLAVGVSGTAAYAALSTDPAKDIPANVQAMSFAPVPSQNVVYQISEGKGPLGHNFESPLGNVANHVKAFGPNPFQLRVVLNGDGVALLHRAKSEASLQQRVDALRAKGVVFEVCYNTLRERRIDPDADLYGVKREDIVSSGVAEVAALQAKGFIYMKP
jgi:hypothetical protein